MIRGEAVTLYRRVEGEEDEMGEPVTTWEAETVENVLWSQGGSDGLGDGTRPLGTDDEVTVHFPKSYAAGVANCEIEVGGIRYAVVGDPMGHMESLTPGAWNRPVTCRRVEG